MKTQKSKNSGLVKSSSLIMLVIMIIICKNPFFVSSSDESSASAEELIRLTFVPPQQIFFQKNEPLQLETEKLYLKMKLTEEAINHEKEKIKNTESALDITMAKMNEYLIVENEPALDIRVTNSIVFPNAEAVDLTTAVDLNTDNFLQELKILAAEKTRDAIELYSLEKRTRQYLTIETEKPLELEEWMTSDKCWCPELRESMAFAESKKDK